MTKKGQQFILNKGAINVTDLTALASVTDSLLNDGTLVSVTSL